MSAILIGYPIGILRLEEFEWIHHTQWVRIRSTKEFRIGMMVKCQSAAESTCGIVLGVGKKSVLLELPDGATAKKKFTSQNLFFREQPAEPTKAPLSVSIIFCGEFPRSGVR